MKVTEICTPNILKYSCDSCDYNTSHKNDFVKHLHTKKHLEQQIGNLNPKNPKKSQLYFCENCDYSTSHKSHFDKHRETLKCISVTKCRKVPKSAEKCRKVPQKLPTSPNQFASATCTNCESIVEYEPEMTGLSPPAMTIFACKCGKEFKTRSGLWRHQKHPTSCSGESSSDTIIRLLIDSQQTHHLNEQRHEETILKLVDMVKDISKDRSIINSNSNNTNCHNKQFNLQFFLNETCKDAYNISEFVEQLDVTMEDMLNTSRVGYTEGVSQIIVNGLKALDETKRPIHCTDVKRETFYIKENDTWNKEPEDKPILLGAVKKIAGKNIKQISEWCKQHPNYRDAASRDNDVYLKMLVNVMQGGTDNEINNSFKTVFRNVATGAQIKKH